MTTVIGLDLSLAATGVAFWRDGEVGVRTWRTPRPDGDYNGWAMARRLRRIIQPLCDLIGGDPDVLVCKEDRLNSMDVPGNSALDLAGLHAVVDYVLASRGVPIAKVNLMHLKSYATGKGNADKPTMLIQASACLVRAGIRLHVANHNEADALWALDMAMRRYGLPLLGAAKPEVAAKAQWPWFTGLADWLAANPKEATHDA